MESATDELIMEIRATWNAPDEETARAGYRELVERTGAQITEVTQAPFETGHPDLFVLRLQKSDRLRPRETPLDGMTRTARHWYALFRQDQEPFTNQEREMGSMGFIDEAGELVPPGSFVTIAVRMADVHSRFDDIEWLIPDMPEGYEMYRDSGPDLLPLFGTKTVLYTETVRWDLPTAERELQHSLAQIPHAVMTGSPTVLATRHLRFRSFITVTDDTVTDAYHAALSYLGDRPWTITQDTPTELRAEHAPQPPPTTGFLRWELQIIQVLDDE